MDILDDKIQKEVDQRVKFKLDAFFTGMENRIRANTMSEFHLVMEGDHIGGRKAGAYKEAWEQVKSAFQKEVHMPVPRDDMYENVRVLAKREAVDMVMAWMDHKNMGKREWHRERHFFEKLIVRAVEKAQNF